MWPARCYLACRRRGRRGYRIPLAYKRIILDELPGDASYPGFPRNGPKRSQAREDRFRPFCVHVVLSHPLSHATGWGIFAKVENGWRDVVRHSCAAPTRPYRTVGGPFVSPAHRRHWTGSPNGGSKGRTAKEFIPSESVLACMYGRNAMITG